MFQHKCEPFRDYIFYFHNNIARPPNVNKPLSAPPDKTTIS